MLVTRHNIAEVKEALEQRTCYALDTETTGLRPYHGDEPFAVIVDEFYFDLRGEDAVLSKDALHSLFLFPDKRWYLCNAKFDIAFIHRIFSNRAMPRGEIFDIGVAHRVLNYTATRGDFSLDELAKQHGCRKSDTVERYIKDHKLWTDIERPGLGTPYRAKHFDKVPQDIIVPYALQDTKATRTIAEQQEETFRILHKEAKANGWPSQYDLFQTESKLIRVVYEMQDRGIRVDRDFCERAIDHEYEVMKDAKDEFKKTTGLDYKVSNPLFQKVFKSDHERWVYPVDRKTGKKKKSPSFEQDILKKFTNPLAETVLRIKHAKANLNYYYGFLWQADGQDIIHAELNQHAARTGRFSSSSPNLQNLKKRGVDLTQPFVVRRALVPREGCFFGMIDYDQVEYRIMLDYAGAKNLIDAVKDGLDVHSATAELAGITRDQAKTVNFGLIYGQGDPALAESLGIPIEEARDIKHKIFSAAPEIQRFIAQVKERCNTRGFVFNWAGRRYDIPWYDVFKAPNAVIQGAAADVIKRAMVDIHEYLGRSSTFNLLCIHDELVFEGPRNELDILPKLAEIMCRAYPHKHLHLTAGIDYSFKSLADKISYMETP